NGLQAIDVQKHPWVLVHDAARPCVTHEDIDKIIEQCTESNCGGLLAAQVVDTMKQSSTIKPNIVGSTIERSNLWHAFTPQMYKTVELKQAIEQALEQGLAITDESSAIELAGLPSLLISGRRDNIKITRPEDLALAAFYLEQQELNQQELEQ
ncbi:MAG: 2-C-methyl-D-erythritol 4-phosphate cytidylyltransferase, partial [Colwellia sp.]|nr:2-C-methyl-D-erythritol 4-phosphate cytidylyltransferase [Colwellia sp.]